MISTSRHPLAKVVSRQLASVLAVLAMAVGFSVPSYAEQEPAEVVRAASAKLLSQLESDKGAVKVDETRMVQLIEQIILPIVDEQKFAKRVLGKTWKKATKDDRQAFVSGMSKMLVKSYAGAFSVIDGHEILFGGTRYNKRKNQALVRASIHKEGATDILVDFRMTKKKGQQEWLVSDVIIEGISLSKSFRGQFSEKIKNQGLSVVIASLNQTGTI